MEEFPGNSRKAGKSEPRSEPDNKRVEEAVTTAKIGKRRVGLGRRLKQTFIVGDARSTTEYVVGEVVIPAIRDMLFEMVESGFRRMIYGNSNRPGGGAPSGYSSVGHVAYNRMSQPSTSHPAMTSSPTVSRQSRARHSFQELVIPSREDANEVLDRMYDIMSRYGSVSIADLYELTGVQSSHTDIKWGWTELRGAKAVRLRQGGFLLDLPEPKPLG